MEENNTDSHPVQAEETAPKVNSSRVEQITNLRTNSGTAPLKRPVEVSRGEDGRLDPESRARIKEVVAAKQNHHASKEAANISNMEAAMAKVDSQKDTTLSQIAEMTQSGKNLSNAAIPTRAHSRESGALLG